VTAEHNGTITLNLATEQATALLTLLANRS
jgi:hypothetical protein